MIIVKVSNSLTYFKKKFSYFRTDKIWGYFDKYSLETLEREKHDFSCHLQRRQALLSGFLFKLDTSDTN